MKSTFFILSILAIFTMVACDSEPEKTAIIEIEEISALELLSTEIHPESGEFFVYMYRKFKRQIGKPAEEGESLVQIEIQEVNDQGTVFSYRQIVEVPKDQENTQIGDLLRASDYTLLVHADPNWETIQIVNFDEIHPKLIRVAELTVEIASEGKSEAEKKKYRDGLVSMFHDRQIAYGIVYKQVGLFFLGAGWTGYEGQERVIESELPNPFGGPAFPALLGVALENDQALGATKLHYTLRIDPDRLSDMMSSIVTSVTQRLSVEDPGLKWDPEDIYMLDKAEYILGSETSMFSRIEFKRIIRLDIPNQPSGEHKEVYSWELIEHGKLSGDP